MELYRRMIPDFSFYDERGTLTQLVHEGYEQINVLITKSGVVRGRHYHRRTTEAFYIVDGELTVTFERNSEKEDVTFQKGEFFCVLPEVRHTMCFVADTILVALYEHCVENADGTKDIFSD